MPPGAWAVPPRPQPWYPQPPSVSIPPPAPYAQQPLFPVQNVRLPATASPAVSTSQVTPPGLPTSTPVAVSQPLFPVVGNNHTTTQSSTFSAPSLSTSDPSITPALSASVPVDVYSGANTSFISSYQTLGVPGDQMFSFFFPLKNYEWFYDFILYAFTLIFESILRDALFQTSDDFIL